MEFMFNEIYFKGSQYLLPGSYYQESRQIEFDLENCPHEVILEAFFENQYKNLILHDGEPISFVIYSESKDSFYISGGVLTYNTTSDDEGIFFTRVMVTNFDYTLGNSEQQIGELSIDRFLCAFQTNSRFSPFMSYTPIELIYNDFEISISRRKTDQYTHILLIDISSEFHTSAEKFDSVMLTVLELVTLISGVSPLLKHRILFTADKAVSLHRELVRKHYSSTHQRIQYPISQIDSNAINEESLTRYLDLKKRLGILIDLLLTILNGDDYLEMKCANLVQSIEGFYRSAYKTQGSLKQILNLAFDQDLTRSLLTHDEFYGTKSPVRNFSFLEKACNHRNYLSHLNINTKKPIFEQHELYYAFTKLSLCLRIAIINKIEIPIDDDLLKQSIDKSNNYL